MMDMSTCGGEEKSQAVALKWCGGMERDEVSDRGMRAAIIVGAAGPVEYPLVSRRITCQSCSSLLIDL